MNKKILFTTALLTTMIANINTTYAMAGHAPGPTFIINDDTYIGDHTGFVSSEIFAERGYIGIDNLGISGYIYLTDTSVYGDGAMVFLTDENDNPSSLRGDTSIKNGIEIAEDATLFLNVIDTASTGDITLNRGSELSLDVMDTATLGPIDGKEEGLGTVNLVSAALLTNNIGDVNRVNTVNIFNQGDTDRASINRDITTKSLISEAGTTSIIGSQISANEGYVRGDLYMNGSSYAGIGENSDLYIEENLTLHSTQIATNSMTIDSGYAVLRDSNIHTEDYFSASNALDLRDSHITGNGTIVFKGDQPADSNKFTLIDSTIQQNIEVGEYTYLTLEMEGDSSISDITLDNWATIELDGIQDTSTLGAIDGISTGAGDVFIDGDVILDNAIGAKNSVKMVEIMDDNTVTSNKSINANTVNFSGDGNLYVTDSDITADITTSNDGQGTVHLAGSGNVVGNIGTASHSLKGFGTNGSSVVSTYALPTDIYANWVWVGNGSTFKLQGDTNIARNTEVSADDEAIIDLGSYTLTTDGNFELSDGSILKTTIDENGHGQINAQGTAQIDSESKIIINIAREKIRNGEVFSLVTSSDGRRIEIIEDGNIIAVMDADNIQDNSYFYDFIQKEGANNFDLEAVVAVDLSASMDIDSSSDLGEALQDGLENNKLSEELLANLKTIDQMSGTEKTTAIKKLSGESSGANVAAVIDGANKVSSVVSNRISGLSSGDEANPVYGVWGDFMIGTADQDAIDGYNGYEVDHYGFTFGADKEVGENAKIGLALSYMDTDVDGTEGSVGDGTEVDTYTATVYGEYEFSNNVNLEGQASVGLSNYDTTRGTGTDTAYGEYDGMLYGLRTDLTKEISFENNIAITPLIGIAYSHTSLDEYTETGSASALYIKNASYNSISSNLGAEVEFETKSSNISPSIHGYWNHEFNDDTYDTTSRFTGGSYFTTTGMKPDADTFNIGTELELSNDSNWEFTLSYDADIKDEYLGHRGNLRIRKEF